MWAVAREQWVNRELCERREKGQWAYENQIGERDVEGNG